MIADDAAPSTGGRSTQLPDRHALSARRSRATSGHDRRLPRPNRSCAPPRTPRRRGPSSTTMWQQAERESESRPHVLQVIVASVPSVSGSIRATTSPPGAISLSRCATAGGIVRPGLNHQEDSVVARGRTAGTAGRDSPERTVAGHRRLTTCRSAVVRLLRVRSPTRASFPSAYPARLVRPPPPKIPTTASRPVVALGRRDGGRHDRHGPRPARGFAAAPSRPPSGVSGSPRLEQRPRR